jgi:hypothetical protein
VDCEQVREMIDAYALGAASPDEAKAVEEHVAGCIACWDELRKSQSAAGMLALSSPIQAPPPQLRDRILTNAGKKDRTPIFIGEFLRGRGSVWPAATGMLGSAAAAVLVFAVFLQAQVDDLQGDRDQLQHQVSEQGNILSVASASDVFTVSLVSMPEDSGPATTQAAQPGGEYLWSRSQQKGVIFCYNLPALSGGEVYQAWYITGAEPVDAGTFTPVDGQCQHLMKPVVADISETGVGLTREKNGGSQKPSGRWLIFALFD